MGNENRRIEKALFTFASISLISIGFLLFSGLTDELKQYQNEFGIEQWPSVNKRLDQGEFIYILNNGLAPLKREKAIQAIAPSSRQLMRISAPYYQVRDDNVAKIRIYVSNQSGDHSS